MHFVLLTDSVRNISTPTFSVELIHIGWCGNAESLSGAEATAVEEDGQVDDVPHVVVAVDIGVAEHAVEVLIYSFDDDMRVAGKDGDEGTFGKKHSNLRTQDIRKTLGHWSLLKKWHHLFTLQNLWLFSEKHRRYFEKCQLFCVHTMKVLFGYQPSLQKKFIQDWNCKVNNEILSFLSELLL